MSQKIISSERKQQSELVKEKAIEFYDQEHNLSSEDRKQLHEFFEGQSQKMLFTFIGCIAIGAALPFAFIQKKRGSLLRLDLSILGAFVSGAVFPRLFFNGIYTRQIEQSRDNFGDYSTVFQTISKTPDPVSNAAFWSDYFRKSSEDPNFRIKDPRIIEKSIDYISIENKSDISTESRPGSYKYSEEISSPSLSAQSPSGWDKIRLEHDGDNFKKIDGHTAEIGSIFDDKN